MTDTKSPELARAEEAALRLLESTDRAWICGVGLLSSPTTPAPTRSDLHRMIEQTIELGFFPNGRAAYDELGSRSDDASPQDGAPIYTAVSRDGSSRMFVGLIGTDTVVFAQSFEVEPGRQGFLLPDVETVFTDLFNLAFVRGLQIDFTGRYDMCVSLVDRTPAGDALLWVVDEVQGGVRRASAEVADVGDLVGRTETGRPLEDYLDVVRDVGRRAAAAFGVTSSQWIPQEDTVEVEAEMKERRRTLGLTE